MKKKVFLGAVVVLTIAVASTTVWAEEKHSAKSPVPAILGGVAQGDCIMLEDSEMRSVRGECLGPWWTNFINTDFLVPDWLRNLVMPYEFCGYGLCRRIQYNASF